MKTATLGFLGCGNIGSGVWNVLHEISSQLQEQYDVSLEVRKILVKSLNEPVKADVPKDLLTERVEDILSDPQIDIVCEFMGGEHPAADYMLAALRAGKHVVTANKKALSLHWDALQRCAQEHRRCLMYEASVGGATPVIAVLRESLCCNKVLSVFGIINGTTNQILTDMEEKGWAYRDALKNAQVLGLAEPDPTDDVEGFDAAYKLSILSAISFFRTVDPAQIPRTGITGVTPEDIEAAKHFHCKIRLVAKAGLCPEGLSLSVQPMFLSEKHPLSSVQGAYNGIFIQGHACGEMFLKGKGAGSAPTGAAVASDIVKIAAGSALCTVPIVQRAAIAEDNQKYARILRLQKTAQCSAASPFFAASSLCLDEQIYEWGGWIYVPTLPITDAECARLSSDAQEAFREPVTVYCVIR